MLLPQVSKTSEYVSFFLYYNEQKLFVKFTVRINSIVAPSVERKQLCESRKTQISDVVKDIDIRRFVANFKVDHLITKMENLHGEMYEKLVLYCCASDKV